MNTQTSFSFGAMITSGYHLFKKHTKFIILAGLATVIVQILLQLIQNGARMNRGGFIEILTMFFVGLIGLLIAIGWSKVFLKLTRNQVALWNDFKSEPKLWLVFIKTYLWYLAYFLAFAIAAVIIFALLAIIGFSTGITWLAITGIILGVIAFIVITVYFKVRYWFTDYVILDNQGLASHDIFKKSGSLTKGAFFKLFGFMIVLGLVNLLGLICLVVGLFVTIPTTKLAEVKLYEYLKNLKEAQSA